MQKVILITGVASGIGLYIAQQYCKDNAYKVIGLDIKEPIEAIDNMEFI